MYDRTQLDGWTKLADNQTGEKKEKKKLNKKWIIMELCLDYHIRNRYHILTAIRWVEKDQTWMND